MKRETKIIIGMGIAILILLLALIVPRVMDSIKTKYMQEGYNQCVLMTVDAIISDLQTQGYTQVFVGNQTIRLGVINESYFE